MSRSKFVLAALALTAIAVLSFGGSSTPSAPGAESTPAFVPGELIVKFKPNAGNLDRSLARSNLGAREKRSFRSQAEVWSLRAGARVDDAIRQLKARSDVEYAEPNYIWTLDVVPNDPRMPDLWGMLNTGQTGGTADADIDADMAWGVSTGSHDVVVAVIDTGVDYNHPDLAANIWTNPGEIPGNGIDDDGNGYIDDIHGWDWVNDDNDPFDDNGHGTHTSGTIGAIGDNGIGVAGVNWNVSIMGLKFLSGAGSGSTEDAVSAVEYATMMGVDLTSNSWGGGGFSQALYDAIAAAGAADQLFIAAAGNGGTNTDTSPHYPSSYDLPNLISVAATDHNDQYASFSNWGAVTVDVAAPGEDILSTLPGNSYGFNSGTSMATPHVAGLAALIRAVSPGVPWTQVKTLILNSADDITNPAKPTLTNGRINAFFAIAEPDDVPPAPITDLATANPTSNALGLTWTATGDDGTDGTASFYQVRYSTAPIDGNWDLATLAPNAPPPAASGTPESMEVTGLDANTFYYFAIKAFDEWANASDLGANATGTTLPPPTADASPLSITDTLFTGESATHIVTLTNIGVGTLDYTIPTPIVGEPIAAALPIEFGKDEVDPRSGDPITAGTGGPDGGGYRWVDSDEPGGPVFSWNDISGTGILVGPLGDDATSDPIDLNFGFPFYGTTFGSMRVASNGFISFTSTSTAYSNQPLPSTGAPANMVAPFWDDLNPSAGGSIYYQLFSNQAVIQYNEVAHYGTPSPGTYTFQVILDASGAITYQYLTLVGETASCTVGIQNGTQSVGTTIAFNQSYLHDNMAIRIAAIPQWLTASPTSGRLYGGQSAQVGVNLDASGLEGALYPGEVHILTNDPANPDIVVSVALDVEGAPDAVISPTSLAFGDGYLFIPYEQTLTVTNAGTDVLHVSDILVVGKVVSDLTASPRTFNLLPHSSQVVTVTWTPSLLGSFFGSLTVLSDDAGQPSILVPVTGNGVEPPEVVLSPTSFEETLFTGQKVRRTLRVTNTGGSDLDIYQAGTDLGGASLVVVNDNGTTGSGGPDAFGYSWSDSDDPGGPAFDWVDISGIGTPINFPSLDDANSGPFPIGFTFPFYGNNFSTINASTNGWLSFTSTSTDLSNSTLPGTGSPENLLAAFHDDLRFSSAGAAAHYYNDGSRLIVQYTDVQKYFSNGSLTFQVILYPNGKIVYQYLTMTGALLDSSTVGIQNDDKTIGLQVAYNEDYIHDSLAVQFSTTPDWLTVSPPSATVPAGGSVNFDVVFDATDREGGDYTGAVVLNTNIGQYQAPATLHVIGVPLAGIIPDAYDYGTRYVGYSHLTNFRVVNTGTDVLNVSDVVSTDPTLIIGELQTGGSPEITQIDAGFSLPPGSARLFALAWQPVAEVALAAQVVVHSDDPVNPTISMNVTGNAIFAPIAAWSPASFTENLLVGDVVNRTLHLENQGGSDLNYTVALQEIGAANVTVYPDVKVGKGEELPGPGILGSGGPDVFGYKWVDSDDPTGPTFDWVDISAIGTPVDLGPPTVDDDNSGPIDMGMSFPFYGDTFTTVNVCSNGWLSFTSTSTDLGNSALPSTGDPENLLAAFFDDLRFASAGAAAHYYADGTRFIVQYTDVQKYSAIGSLTFQVILYPDGRIVYQYLTMQGTLNSATIGIQNATKDDGLTVVYNAAYVHDAMAIVFRPLVEWLSVDPLIGTVPAGTFTDLDVTINTSVLIGGDYPASIDLTTNDPAHGTIRVPVNVHVTGIPDIDVAPTSLAFPTTFVGFGSTLQVNVTNVGTDVLTITDYSLTGDFTLTGLTLPATVAVGQTLPLSVEFVPTVAGAHAGTLTLISDDPDEASVEVTLSGDALIAPVIETTPTFINTAMAPGGTTDVNLQICNTGGSDLNWSSTANISSGSPVTVYDELKLGKEEPDPRPGILGAGGPDMFGYTWKDSDEPGGPVYDWVDISGIGTPITFSSTGYSDDGNSGPLPIGFPFNYYGQTFTEFRACTNGWLSFTSALTAYTNQPLPNSGSGVPENLLSIFWDDLVLRNGTGSEPTPSMVYYYYDGTRFIVQFDNMYRIAQYADDLNFQIILYPSGKIVYQYETMATATLNSNTVGIQNQSKDDGLTAVYNGVYVHDNMAVEFSAAPEWLLLDPTSGTIPAGECQDMTVTLDASELAEGIHEATIDLTSNDPGNPLYQVPVTLNVNQPPVAMCADVVVATGPDNCIANASIDNGSYDPDGGPVSLMQSPAGPYPLGDTMVTLTVTDETGLTASCSATVTVIDVTPPALMFSLSPDNLWPPNHQMVDVEATVFATDNCGDPMVVLTGISSNEPDDGSGDGSTINDIQGAEIGTSDFAFQLRAERSAQGEGRIYTAVYTAMDASGNMAVAEDYAFVPHDQSDPILINVMPSVAGTTIAWPLVEEAVHYNVIRALLKDVRDAGDIYDLGQVYCIESHSLDENTIGSEDFNTPRPGEMFLYMVEFNFADGTTSTYGTETAAKPRYPSGGNCQ